MKKQKIPGFTLIELMIVISLISIVILSASNINFKKISDKQKLEGFFYQIKTNIETTTNNALIWKAVKLPSDSMIVPKLWRIDFNSDWNWTIKTYYSEDWTIFNLFTNSNIISGDFQIIEAKTKNWLDLLNSSNWTGWILINWWTLTLIWDWISVSDKILEIEIKFRGSSKIFTINTTSGVIEEK